jgi:hypothetical protein
MGFRASRSDFTVGVAPQPIWRIRALREFPRYLLYALCAAGLAASARFAIAPPRPARPAAHAPGEPSSDLAAEGFASLFARRYLSWNSAEPQRHDAEMEAFGDGTSEAPDVRVPAGGEQRVLSATVVQSREARPRERVYTVAAETDASGLIYLSVPVARGADGRLALAGYPAFVGPPATGPAQLFSGSGEVTEPALYDVVARALRNYLAGAVDELSADLTVGAQVSLPTEPLTLESVERTSWASGRETVLAVVHADDQHGVQYTLGYELDVHQEQGRWEVGAVQMDPLS